MNITTSQNGHHKDYSSADASPAATQVTPAQDSAVAKTYTQYAGVNSQNKGLLLVGAVIAIIVLSHYSFFHVKKNI